MSWIAVGVAGVGAATKVVGGIVQNNQASSIEKNNFRPTQTVDPAYQQNVNTAQQTAIQGLPQAQYNYALNNINRNQSGGIQALSRSANPGAGLASLVRAGNDATMSLDAQSAQMRNQNILNLMRQRSVLAQQRQAAFDWNNKGKYTEQLAKSQALRGAGIQNINSGANDVATAGMMLLSNRPQNSTDGSNPYNPQGYNPADSSYGNLSGRAGRLA